MRVKKRNGMDARGDVSLSVFKFDENGERVYVDYFGKDNLIVEIGRSVVVDLVLGESDKELTFIEWGSGGAPSYPAGNPLQEHEVEDKDEELGKMVIKKLLNEHTRVSTTSFRYVETLISDEVDANINEAGLIFRGRDTGQEALFARITFPTVSLLADKGFGIELTWTINFRKIIYKQEAGQ